MGGVSAASDEAYRQGASAVLVVEENLETLDDQGRADVWRAAIKSYRDAESQHSLSTLFRFSTADDGALVLLFINTTIVASCLNDLLPLALELPSAQQASATEALKVAHTMVSSDGANFSLAIVDHLVHSLSAIGEDRVRKYIQQKCGRDWGPAPLASLGGLGSLLDLLQTELVALQRFFSDAANQEVAATALSRILERANDGLRATALSKMSPEAVSTYVAEFQQAASESYRLEIFGTGPVSIRRFNAWLAREAKAQREQDPSEARKRFVANSIQYFVNEKNWQLFVEGSASNRLELCRITTGKNGNNRRFLFRRPGLGKEYVATATTLPVLEATKG